MINKKTVKQYFNKWFKEQYIEENDWRFKALLRILNKKDKEVKNSLDGATVKREHLIDFADWRDKNEDWINHNCYDNNNVVDAYCKSIK